MISIPSMPVAVYDVSLGGASGHNHPHHHHHHPHHPHHHHQHHHRKNNSMCPESLLDICAKVVAYHIPFQRIEERYQRIPEPVQARIIYWSFPRNEKDICMYSSLTSDSHHYSCSSSAASSLTSDTEIPFYQGVRLYESGSVDNVLQVGFHLSGVVTVKTPGPPPPSSSSSSSASNSSNSNSNNVTASSSSLSASSGLNYAQGSERRYRVSITFDRCKIISVTCSCDKKEIFWCEHVVALTLFRMRNPHLVKLRVPISETLLQLDRQQLQKLIQYLVAEHHTEVLPTAQRLADEILRSSSTINRIDGAPDPTAGSCAEDEHSWHLDEEQVSDQVRIHLVTISSTSGSTSKSNHLNALFAKVKEMLKAKDSNAARMLRLITEQFLVDPRLQHAYRQGTAQQDQKCRPLWDQLSSLWVCVVLNPHATRQEKDHWRSLLERWSKSPVCPLEDAVVKFSTRRGIKRRRISINDEFSSDDDEEENDSSRSNRHNHNSSQSRSYLTAPHIPRTIFHRALEASQLRWDDPHLRFILDQKSTISHVPSSSASSLFNSQGYPLWNEPVPIACARVEALRSCGYRQEALRLAVAVVRTMKRQQLEWQYKKGKEQALLESNLTKSQVSLNPIYCNTEGWLGNPMFPMGSLFDTLAEASLTYDSKPLDHYYPTFLTESSSTQSVNNSTTITAHASHEDALLLNPFHPIRNHDKPHYQHILVPGSRDPNESYLTLAVEAALIGLGQQRIIPAGQHVQIKAQAQEKNLIQKLEDIELDNTLMTVLLKQGNLLLEGGPYSGLGVGIHPESVPMHKFACYLFQALLFRHPDLAYRIGLRAMRLPLLENLEINDEGSSNAHNNLLRHPRLQQITKGYEDKQRLLAATMLCAAKNDELRLKKVLESAQQHLHSYTQLFELAKSAFKTAIPDNRCRHQHLLSAAYELGLQVLKMTLSHQGLPDSLKRQDYVEWMVDCATEFGLQGLITLMHSWTELFTPLEACKTVAPRIMSSPTVMKLGLHFQQQEELSACARSLALECAKNDPSNCALSSLRLCESEVYAFEAAYSIVLRAGSSNLMSSAQLFEVAKHIEQRGCHPRAFKLALFAVRNVQIAANGDNHNTANDINWAFNLAMSLGKNELASLIPILVKNVQCATILASILHKCALPQQGSFASCLDGKRRCIKALPLDKTPLRQLLDAAINAFVQTTHSRLTHISPRHYTDFIEFLSKARETFHLSPEGHIQFHQLLDNMKMMYKGKKKLMNLVKERFG